MKPPKKPLKELVATFKGEHARVAEAILHDYLQQMQKIPGSSTKHQSWPGGYIGHIEEAMNIASVLYDNLNDLRTLPFTKSQALFCVFLHDFDKLLRYHVLPDGEIQKGQYDKNYLEKTKTLLAESYGYDLSDEEYNALKYAHGEGDDYHPTDRVMLPLATLVHCADIISARVWHDYGRSSKTWDEIQS